MICDGECLLGLHKCVTVFLLLSFWRRSTFLRTTLCLPCGPWFWLDRHWRATRCIKASTFQTQHWIFFSIFFSSLENLIHWLLLSLLNLVCRWQTWCKKRCLTFWNTDLREGKLPVTFLKTQAPIPLPSSLFLTKSIGWYLSLPRG